MKHTSYTDLIMTLYPEDNASGCRSITFQVCDDCCLQCSYCYQTHKGHNYMTKETAKAIIDLLFKMYDENKPDAFINHTTHGIVLDFIGGEPLMNVEIMEFATDYFLEQCITNGFIISVQVSRQMVFYTLNQKYKHICKNFMILFL